MVGREETKILMLRRLLQASRKPAQLGSQESRKKISQININDLASAKRGEFVRN
jgi:hypothetical protein